MSVRGPVVDQSQVRWAMERIHHETNDEQTDDGDRIVFHSKNTPKFLVQPRPVGFTAQEATKLLPRSCNRALQPPAPVKTHVVLSAVALVGTALPATHVGQPALKRSPLPPPSSNPRGHPLHARMLVRGIPGDQPVESVDHRDETMRFVK